MRVVAFVPQRNFDRVWSLAMWLSHPPRPISLPRFPGRKPLCCELGLSHRHTQGNTHALVASSRPDSRRAPVVRLSSVRREPTKLACSAGGVLRSRAPSSPTTRSSAGILNANQIVPKPSRMALPRAKKSAEVATVKRGFRTCSWTCWRRPCEARVRDVHRPASIYWPPLGRTTA